MSRLLTIDQPSSGIPGEWTKTSYRCAKPIRSAANLYGIQDDLDFIKVQLARLPSRNEVWRAAMLGMLGGAVATHRHVPALLYPFFSVGH